MLESAQLCERESRTRLELHRLQGALERETLDRTRAEQEAEQAKDALIKVSIDHACSFHQTITVVVSCTN